MILPIVFSVMTAWGATPLFRCEVGPETVLEIQSNLNASLKIRKSTLALRVVSAEVTPNGVVPGARIELSCRHCTKTHPTILTPIILGIKETGSKSQAHAVLQYETNVPSQRCRVSRYQRNSLFQMLSMK